MIPAHRASARPNDNHPDPGEKALDISFSLSIPAGPLRLNKEQALALGEQKVLGYQIARDEVFRMPHFLICMKEIMQNDPKLDAGDTKILHSLMRACARTIYLQRKAAENSEPGESDTTRLEKRLEVNRKLLESLSEKSPHIQAGVLAYQEVLYRVRHVFRNYSIELPQELRADLELLQKSVLYSIRRSFAQNADLFRPRAGQKYYARTQSALVEAISEASDQIQRCMQGKTGNISGLAEHTPDTRVHQSYERLFSAVEQYQSAERTLVNSVQLLALAKARQHASPFVSEEDLFQEATMGCIHAAAVYDPSRGFTFTTCATPWIKQAILRYIDEHANNIRVPGWAIELQRKFQGLLDGFRKEQNRDPDDKEYQKLIELSGISAKNADFLIGAPRFTSSLEKEHLESCEDQASVGPLDWTILQEELVRLRATGEQ